MGKLRQKYEDNGEVKHEDTLTDWMASGAQKPHSVRGEMLKTGLCLRIQPKKFWIRPAAFEVPKLPHAKSLSFLPSFPTIDPPTEMFHDHIVNSGGVKEEPPLPTCKDTDCKHCFLFTPKTFEVR